jgi:hypothetical protein
MTPDDCVVTFRLTQEPDFPTGMKKSASPENAKNTTKIMGDETEAC